MVTRLLFLILLFAPGILLAKDRIESRIEYIKHEKHITPGTITLWEREALIVDVTVSSNNEYYYLEADKKSYDGFIVKGYRLKSSNKINSKLPFSKTYRYIIWPTKPGTAQLSLPVVNYISSGAITHRVTIPLQKIAVNSLPAYIPPSIPVGKIFINAGTPQNTLLSRLVITGKPFQYTLTVSGNNVPDVWLPEYYDSILQSENIETITPDTTLTFEHKHNSTVFKRTTRFTALSINTGILELDAIRYTWFDPVSEKLVTEFQALPAMISINYSLQIIIILILVVLTLITVKYSYMLLLNIYARYRILKSIEACNNPNDLSRSLRQLQPVVAIWKTNFSSPLNISLSEWYKLNPRTDKNSLIVQLHESCFSGGKEPIDFSQLKTETINLINKNCLLDRFLNIFI